MQACRCLHACPRTPACPWPQQPLQPPLQPPGLPSPTVGQIACSQIACPTRRVSGRRRLRNSPRHHRGSRPRRPPPPLPPLPPLPPPPLPHPAPTPHWRCLPPPREWHGEEVDGEEGQRRLPRVAKEACGRRGRCRRRRRSSRRPGRSRSGRRSGRRLGRRLGRRRGRRRGRRPPHCQKRRCHRGGHEVLRHHADHPGLAR